jgi:hypothetical protein
MLYFDFEQNYIRTSLDINGRDYSGSFTSSLTIKAAVYKV